MKVYYTCRNKDEVTEDHKDLPCFGATGRVDWNGMNPKLELEYRNFCRRTGCDHPKGGKSQSFIPWDKGNVLSIRLRSDDFRQLFHVSNRKFLDYLVHRSPWAPLFTDTAEQIFHQNYIDMRVDVLPSEVQTWLHIIIRDSVCSPTFGLTFDTLVSGGIPEHLAFGISVIMPRLGLQQVETNFGHEGITTRFNLAWFNQENPSFDQLPVFPYTMAEVHGYVMNINNMFTCGTHTSRIIEDAVRSVSSTQIVTGLFIRKSMRICDPIQLVNAIKEKL